MNVTYKDLKEGYILKIDDDIVIHSVKHRVRHSLSEKEYYLRYDGVSGNALRLDRIPKASGNNFIFQLLHISDKDSFVKEIAGKAFSGAGSFPQVKTLEALTKVVITLFEKPLYNVGDYVTIRKPMIDYDYSLTFLAGMQEKAGNTYEISSTAARGIFPHPEGEEFHYVLKGVSYYWDAAMLMPATEEEKKSVMASDKKEPEEKEEKEIHFITLQDLKDGYVLQETDHININGLDCVINTRLLDGARFWLSSDTVLEQEIYESLEIPEDKKKELAKSCGAVDLSYHSPEFSSLEGLSVFVREILMYKKDDKTPSEKKWSGNPTYFNLKNGRILEKEDILNIHGLEYYVTCGGSDGSRYWLSGFAGITNSEIFEKLGIKDKEAFVEGICPIVCPGCDFPEVGSYEDLTKVVIALYEVPEFKVGEKVRVAHREDGEEDYPEHFIDEMTELEGNEYTITGVNGATYCPSISDKANKRLSEDPNFYELDNEGSEYCWHSSMLEKVSESDKKSEKSSKEVSSSKPLQITLSDLWSGYILKGCDIVCLCDERYKVIQGDGYCFLSNISGGSNHKVFDKLGIRNKMEFCSSYGTVDSGDFPEFNRLDALTACVKQLMLLEQGLCCLDLKDDSGDKPLPEVKKLRLKFAMDISESDKPSYTETVRLPEIEDDFKIIL